MSREDTGSRSEHDAERAEHRRATGAGEDTDAELFAPRSTWTAANVPAHVHAEAAAAPVDRPPF